MRALVLSAAIALSAAAAPAQQPARWRLVEEWRVGGAVQGPHSLLDVRAIRVMPDGRLVILEGKDQQVHILSSRGQPIRTTGKKGAGPGEFRSANGLLVTPDGGIVVHDNSNGRLTFLSPTGDLVRTVRHPPHPEFGTWDARFTADGRLEEGGFVFGMDPVTGVGSFGRPFRGAWTADFARADSRTTPVCPPERDEPPEEVSWQARQGDEAISSAYPFVMINRARINGPDGAHWVGRYPEFRVIHRVTFGTCTVTATLALRGNPIPVPTAILAQQTSRLQQFASSGAGKMGPDPARLRRTLPQFESMLVDALNRLWVERLVARTVSFTTSAANGDRPITITRDRIFAMATDADDVSYLVSYRIERN